MTLEENIKSWIKLDNEIKQLSSELKSLRTQKEDHNQNILEHIKDNNLEHAIIKIGNGRLKFVDTNSTQPLTYKFICECLCDYFKNDDETVMVRPSGTEPLIRIMVESKNSDLAEEYARKLADLAALV